MAASEGGGGGGARPGPPAPPSAHTASVCVCVCVCMCVGEDQVTQLLPALTPPAPPTAWKSTRLKGCTSDSISYWPLLPRAMVSKS